MRQTKTTKAKTVCCFFYELAQASFTSRLKLSGYCGLKVLRPITPSSAAVCKLWFCGILLRSKTTKLRLTNCPASVACVLERLVMVFFCCSFCHKPRLPYQALFALIPSKAKSFLNGKIRLLTQLIV